MKQNSTTTPEQISKKVYAAYVEDGQSAAFEVANKYNVPYEFCKACDTESPSLDHTCLICGQETAPPTPSATMQEGKHSPLPWNFGKTAEGGTMDTKYNQSLAISDKTHTNLIAGIFRDCKGGEETAKANAALICEAVNNYDTLKKDNEALTVQLNSESDYQALQRGEIDSLRLANSELLEALKETAQYFHSKYEGKPGSDYFDIAKIEAAIAKHSKP
jgi:hypothetical protein